MKNKEATRIALEELAQVLECGATWPDVMGTAKQHRRVLYRERHYGASYRIKTIALNEALDLAIEGLRDLGADDEYIAEVERIAEGD